MVRLGNLAIYQYVRDNPDFYFRNQITLALLTKQKALRLNQIKLLYCHTTSILNDSTDSRRKREPP
jgi:hypothetical protein